MTKVALITDTHWGIRNDTLVFLDYQKRFTENIFFPYLKEHKIEHVIHLGDLFDRRKYINFNTLARTRTDFLNPLMNQTTHIIAGNHDVALKNTNTLNSLVEVVAGKHPWVKIYTQSPVTVNIGGIPVLLVPWINPENEKQTLDAIARSDAKFCFGHFELQGFEMERGHVSTKGMDRGLLRGFQAVFSGHYHHRSTDGYVTYLGAPFEMTWGDYGERKGFHVLDLATNDLQFIENPYKLFHRIEYDDTGCETPEQVIGKMATPEVTGAYVKLVVNQKHNPYLFECYLAHLEGLCPHDLKVLHQMQMTIKEDEIVDQCEDTLTIINKSIDSLEVNVEKQALKNLMGELHKRALNLEIA